LKKKQVLFLVKFLAIFIVLQALLFLVDISFLQAGIASLEAGWVGGQSLGSLVYLQGMPFDISPSCTGLVASFILAAVVFALKKPGLKEKAVTFVIGTIALLLVNLLRVYLVLSVASAFNLYLAEVLHIVSWFVMAGLIIALWYYATTRIYKIRDFDGFL
jgi:exosortase/archaeosortase family protein